MSCLSCFSSHGRNEEPPQFRSNSLEPLPPSRVRADPHHDHQFMSHAPSPLKPPQINKGGDKNISSPRINKEGGDGISANTFTYRELAAATKNFRQEYLVGEGGFGRVYKGVLERTGQIVAVKQLDLHGVQGNKEFLVEVFMLSLLNHENLVNLIGYCVDGDQRLLVYEFMQLGSVEDHLLDLLPNQKPLDWCTRMKIALHIVKGLEYLHEAANPPVIYRDMKTSNILLDQDYNAKLSDFGLAKLGPVGDKSHVTSRIMGTLGYCAPEYQRTGQLTVKTDIYSFGVVLLELITGQRAVDRTLRGEEQLLVKRAEPLFKDPSRHSELADLLLRGDFPKKTLNQVVGIAAMCLQDDPSARPLTSDIVTALSHLYVLPDGALVSPVASLGSTILVDIENDEDNLSGQEREDAIAEAIEWGSNSRMQSFSC